MQKHPRLVIGLVLVAAFVILGLVMPPFAGHDPRDWNTFPKNIKPNQAHLLGTTGLGQDIFWLLTYSLRNSLILGVLVGFFATLIGVTLGVFAGLKGGWADRGLSLLMDTFIVVPSLPILILLASLLQGRASILIISAVLIVFNLLHFHLLLHVDEFDIEAKFARHELDHFGIETLVNGNHDAEAHTFTDHVGKAHIHQVGQLAHADEFSHLQLVIVNCFAHVFGQLLSFFTTLSCLQALAAPGAAG